MYDWHRVTGGPLEHSVLLHASVITMYSEPSRVGVDGCQSSSVRKGEQGQGHKFPFEFRKLYREADLMPEALKEV